MVSLDERKTPLILEYQRGNNKNHLATLKLTVSKKNVKHIFSGAVDPRFRVIQMVVFLLDRLASTNTVLPPQAERLIHPSLKAEVRAW